MSATSTGARRALLGWRMKLLRRRHLNAWNALVIAGATAAAWSYGPRIAVGLGLLASSGGDAADPAAAPELGALTTAALGLLGLGFAVGLVATTAAAFFLIARSPENYLPSYHPVGMRDIVWVRTIELVIACLALWAPPAAAIVASVWAPGLGTGPAVAAGAGVGVLAGPLLAVTSVGLALVAIAIRPEIGRPIEQTSRTPRGWGFAKLIAAIAPWKLGIDGRMLLRRDLVLLLRRAYPRTLLIPVVIATGPLLAALFISAESPPGERLVYTFIAGTFASALVSFLIAIDLPRWRSGWALLDRLTPVRGKPARRAQSALASLFAVPAAALPAATLPLIVAEVPWSEMVRPIGGLAVVGLVIAHYAASFGMATGAHTPQLPSATSGGGAGSAGGSGGAGGQETAAYPISAGALALFVGFLELLPVIQWIVPFAWPYMIRGAAISAERAWEQTEVGA